MADTFQMVGFYVSFQVCVFAEVGMTGRALGLFSLVDSFNMTLQVGFPREMCTANCTMCFLSLMYSVNVSFQICILAEIRMADWALGFAWDNWVVTGCYMIGNAPG